MVFEHMEYRDYLQAYLETLPNAGYGEASKFAKALGVSSTFVSQTLSGLKQLTPEQAELLSGYLGHSALEADYFFYLVQLDRAGTTRLKSYCRKKLAEIKERSLSLVNRVKPKKTLADEERAVFYSSALYSAIHLYTSTHPHGRTSLEIAERFQLSRAKCTQMIEFLSQCGLIKEQKGRFTMGTQSTHVPVGSPYLLQHHANWRQRAIQRSEDLETNELMYTGNVSLARADFEVLREEMVGFIQKFLKRVHDSPAEEVACFNLDFFWVRK